MPIPPSYHRQVELGQPTWLDYTFAEYKIWCHNITPPQTSEQAHRSNLAGRWCSLASRAPVVAGGPGDNVLALGGSAC